MLYLFSFLVGALLVLVIVNKPIRIEVKKTIKEEKAEVSKPVAVKVEPVEDIEKELQAVKQEVYADVMNEFYGMDVIKDGKEKE